MSLLAARLNGSDSSGHPTGAALKAAGIEATGIYLGGAFAATPAMIADYTAHGIWIFSIWEVKAGASAGGANKGAVDASAAIHAALGIKQPAHSAIYFTDDNSSIPQNTVLDYWRGTSTIRQDKYLNGGYGPHAVCTAGLTGKIIDTAMVAGGWENGKPETGIAIKQQVAQRTIGGVTCDLDSVLLPAQAGLWNGHGLYAPITADQYAADHGMVRIDKAEALLCVHHKPEIAWYTWSDGAMHGHSYANIPTTGLLFAFKANLDAAHIPHAGA